MDAYDLNGPQPLELSCLHFVRKELDKLEAADDDGEAFVNAICSLPGPMVQAVLEFLGKTGSISDFKLRKLLPAATWSNAVLKRVQLYEVKDTISGAGLLNYSCCNLKEIVLAFDKCNTNQPNLNELWQAFEQSKNTLRVLKLYHYPMSLPEQDHVLNFVAKFPNLKCFCIHTSSENCDICYEHWTNILDSCQSLEEIEIFIPKNKGEISFDTEIFSDGPKTIRSLHFPALLNSSKVRLQRFGLAGLLELDALSHLDISIDDDPEASNVNEPRAIPRKFVVNFMEQLEDGCVLPNLVSLDVSGMREVHSGHIKKLLSSHSRMKFIGLCLLEVEYTNQKSVAESVDHLQISGTFLEKQIILSLRVYQNRALYTREALKSLFMICGQWTERRPDVIELVLKILKNHPDDHLLQLAATACLYELTKNDANLKPVPPKQLVKAAELSLQVLKRFRSSDKRQILKNCLLIFCNDRLLHYPRFNRFEVSRVCLDCMLTVPEHSDRHITRMAVAIVSVLACKITSKETSELTGMDEIRLLLRIAKDRLADKRIDGTLKFDLSALWNLTDESPKACHLFVELDGLDLYVKLLYAFPEDHSIQTKVLGLLNNIAEVPQLHENMIVDDLMQQVGELVLSEEKSVSYFAGGIIANIAYGWTPKFRLQISLKQELLQKLEDAIKRWGTLDSEIVTYRSFRPFLGLLESFHLGPVQHFSLWAIHHVCTLNNERYKDLMTEECVVRLARLRSASITTTERQRTMVDEIFKACDVDKLLL